MSRAVLLVSITLLSAGCLLLEGDGDDRFAGARGDEAGVYRSRRRGKATWILVRIWSEAVDEGSAGVAVQEVAVESLKEDLGRAGLRVAADVPPDGPHEALLLRKSQSGFAAIARGEPVAAFEVGGRPIGGGATHADRGFELVGEPLEDGRIRLEMAPVFRRITGREDEEIRAHALSFVAEIGDGETLLFSSVEGARDPAIRALFGAPEDLRRRLWVQVETL